MPKASDDQIKAVCRLLHSRGREAVPADVRRWLAKLRTVLVRRGEKAPNEQVVCADALTGESNATHALHSYFGDALDNDVDEDEGIGLCGD